MEARASGTRVRELREAPEEAWNVSGTIRYRSMQEVRGHGVHEAVFLRVARRAEAPVVVPCTRWCAVHKVVRRAQGGAVHKVVP